MKKIKTASAEILFVDVSYGAKDFEIDGDSICFELSGAEKSINIALSDDYDELSDYDILGKFNDVEERKFQSICDCTVAPQEEVDTDDVKLQYGIDLPPDEVGVVTYYRTAKEAIKHAIKEAGMNPENVLIITKDIS